MQTVILPGFSSENKTWIETTAANINVEGVIRPVSWDHWLDPSNNFDPHEKADLIAKHTKGGKINIIAKSIGCLVAAYVIEQIPGQINKVILNGIPLTDLKEIERQTLKKSIMMLSFNQLLVIQNSRDPHGSAEDTHAFLPDETNFMQMERDDHDYPYFDQYNSFLVS